MNSHPTKLNSLYYIIGSLEIVINQGQVVTFYYAHVLMSFMCFVRWPFHQQKQIVSSITQVPLIRFQGTVIVKQFHEDNSRQSWQLYEPCDRRNNGYRSLPIVVPKTWKSLSARLEQFRTIEFWKKLFVWFCSIFIYCIRS